MHPSSILEVCPSDYEWEPNEQIRVYQGHLLADGNLALTSMGFMKPTYVQNCIQEETQNVSIQWRPSANSDNVPAGDMQITDWRKQSGK